MLSRTISFTSFNLYNLNEPNLPMYGNQSGWTPEMVERKVIWSAAMLQRAKADVFGFQELWHIDTLARAMDQAGLVEDYLMIVPKGHSGQGIVCAGAVRRDMLEGDPEWIADFPSAFRLQSKGEDRQTAAMFVEISTFSRPVLHFRVKPRRNQPGIHVYVCHFKSKGPTRVTADAWYRKQPDLYKPHLGAIGAALSTIRRTAEALALRMIVTEATKNTNTPVIVLGDLNDGQESNTLDILTEQPRFLQPLSVGGRDTSLYSAQSLQQLRSLRDVYYTYIHQDIHGSLDHILVSEEFYDNSDQRIWKFDRLDIFNDHLNDESLRKVEGASDHGLVRAQFSFRPAR
ncbi:endonuclease/exonuclease/phosphatase family protein [Synechococcales cyanobacterium C]|uniref:Endonuclease/exonuclease/phosphatase family protein n=1 Tax=Petrachloros mirabilis ULC683 TaxID=2781853 RepID=A0A8K2A711_9CYAN|nr:endonuclease/exonuclease/phosphatase family protein [Petrachloros mirabilis]NCJ05635.1 endonuclease/exonuclease/phosphatase family protein [Petrachloros mirabilis ULC683]